MLKGGRWSGWIDGWMDNVRFEWFGMSGDLYIYLECGAVTVFAFMRLVCP